MPASMNVCVGVHVYNLFQKPCNSHYLFFCSSFEATSVFVFVIRVAPLSGSL